MKELAGSDFHHCSSECVTLLSQYGWSEKGAVQTSSPGTTGKRISMWCHTSAM